jgi:CelD/BcsL family acetyltransferase involved in cellulose biosynthesis
MSELSIASYESPEAVATLEKAWRELHADCTYRSVFNGFDFFMASVTAFSEPNILLYVLVATGKDGVVAIFPFQLSRPKDAGRLFWQLEYAAQWEADKPYPLIRRGFEDAAWQALARFLISNRARWHRFHLVEIPEGLAAISELPRLFAPPFYWVRVRDGQSSPVVELDRPWSERWQAHPKMRKKVARMQNAFGERLRFQVYEGADDWQTSLCLYVELESKGWKSGRVGIGKDERTLGFYHDLFSRLAARGGLRVGLLFLDDEPVAAEVAYVEGKTVYFSHGTYDERYAKYSPGMVSTCLFLRYFHDGAFDEGDYLAGFAAYLTPWADRVLTSRKLTILRGSLPVLLAFPRRLVGRLLRPRRTGGPRHRRMKDS